MSHCNGATSVELPCNQTDCFAMLPGDWADAADAKKMNPEKMKGLMCLFGISLILAVVEHNQGRETLQQNVLSAKNG